MLAALIRPLCPISFLASAGLLLRHALRPDAARAAAVPRAHIMPVSDFIKNPCAMLRKDQPDGAKKPILPSMQARSDKTAAAGPAPPSRAPKSLRRLSEEERIKRYMDAAATEADKHHSGAAQCIRASTPFCTCLMWIMFKVGPMYVWLFRKAYWFYTWAPTNVLQMCFGLALCFFGGTFAAAIAAVEAWRQMGWQRSYRDASIIYAQMRRVYDANEKDDMLDEDGNGIVDVDEISPSDLAKRKLTLAMRTVEEPDKLQACSCGGRTAATAPSAPRTRRLTDVHARRRAADGDGQPVGSIPRRARHAAPAVRARRGDGAGHCRDGVAAATEDLFAATPGGAWFRPQALGAYAHHDGHQYHRDRLRMVKSSSLNLGLHLPTPLTHPRPCLRPRPRSCCHSRPHPLSRYIQKVISAFYSGLRGGTMFANAFFAFLEDRGWLAKMPCEGFTKTPYLSEAVGYPIAAVGFYTQLRYGFTLPFPLNLILLPLTIVQWLIEYQMVMGSGAAIGAVG